MSLEPHLEEALEAAQRVLDVTSTPGAREIELEAALAEERARSTALAAELDAARDATQAQSLCGFAALREPVFRTAPGWHDPISSAPRPA